MSDGDHVNRLLEIASDQAQLRNAQDIAAYRLLKATGIKYPHDGCAITLCILLQEARINISDIYQAGSRRASGVASPLDARAARPAAGRRYRLDCGPTHDHGRDHIYLLLKPVNHDEMVIADNQNPKPHFRWVSGKGGKTPTKFFMRAPPASVAAPGSG